MELVDYLKPKTFGGADEETILQGKLVKQGGKSYAKIDNRSALWGPVLGADTLDSGIDIVVAIDQNNKPYVVYPIETTAPPDPTTGDKNYRHVQGAPATLWAVAHSLGKYPSVTIFDSLLEEMEAEVDHIDVNNLTIKFSGPTSGSATLN
jgi:hypothetical protein